MMAERIAQEIEQERQREEAMDQERAKFRQRVAHIPADDPRSQFHALGPGPFLIPQALADAWMKQNGPLPENFMVREIFEVREMLAILDTIPRFAPAPTADYLRVQPDQDSQARVAQWKRERNPYGRRK